MNEPDPIVVGYQNTIGFFRTSSEWPWNARIRVQAAIAELYQGIRHAALSRYQDGSHGRYDEYMSYRQEGQAFTWDEATWGAYDGITCVTSHDYSESEPYIDYDITIATDALNDDWERQIFYLAFEPIPKFVSTRIKIFLGHDPTKMVVKTGSDIPLNESSEQFVAHIGSLWSFNYDTQEDDIGVDDSGAPGFIFKITNNGMSSEEYSHIYVSDNSASSFNTIELPGSGEEATITFTGRIYNNMSIYVRPLIAAKLYFYCPDHIDEFTSGHFVIHYTRGPNEIALHYPDDYENVGGGRFKTSLSSENAFKFRIEHVTDVTYSHITTRVNYGINTYTPTITPNDHMIPPGNSRTFTVENFVMSPTIDTCTVQLYISQIYSLSVTIIHPIDTQFWPDPANGTPAQLRQDQLSLDNGTVATADQPVADAGGTRQYTFTNVLSNHGTGIIDVRPENNGYWHYSGWGSDTSGTKYLLTSEKFVRQSADFTANTYTSAAGTPYVLTITPFEAATFHVKDEGSALGKIKVWVWYPPAWPTGVNNASGGSWSSSWQASTGSDYADLQTNQIIPVPCVRFTQAIHNTPDGTGWADVLDEYTQLEVTVSFGSSYTIPYTHTFTKTGDGRFFDLWPEKFAGSNISAFYASHYTTAGLNITFKAKSAYDRKIRVIRVDYRNNDWNQTNGTETITAAYSASGGALASRIPGNYKEGDTSTTNLTVYVDTDNAVIDGTNKELHLWFTENGTAELSAMYPSDSDLTCTLDSASGYYKFELKTLRYDIWDTPTTPSGARYSSDSHYTMVVGYKEAALDSWYYHGTDFQIQAIINTRFTSNDFSFDNSGYATVYFLCHVMGTSDSRVPDPTGHPGDPTIVFPPESNAMNATQWNAVSDVAVQISGASSSMQFAYAGCVPVTGMGYCYQINVSGGTGFAGTVTFTSTVLNQEDTCTLQNFTSITNVKWWDGATDTTVTNISDAWLSPIPKTGAVKVRLKFKPNHGLNTAGTMTVTAPHDTATYSGGEKIMYRGTAAPAPASSSTYDVEVTLDSVGDFDAANVALGAGNYVYYSGMSIPFTVSIPYTDTTTHPTPYQYTFDIKLGAVLDMYTDNTTGGVLKPETGQTHLVRARAREWYWDTATSQIKDGSYYYGTQNLRQCYIHFTYTSGGTTADIPEDNTSYPPSDPPYKSRRHDSHFDINAPTTWTDPSDGHTYVDDWGAWNIEIYDDTGLGTGALTVYTEITDQAGQTCPQFQWYPTPSVSVQVINHVGIVDVHYWTGLQYQSAGTTNPTNAIIPPVVKGTKNNGETVFAIFIKYANPSDWNMGAGAFSITNSTIRDDVYTDNDTQYHTFRTVKTVNTTGDTINGGQAYDVRLDVLVNWNIGDRNDALSTRIYYTGQPIPLIFSTVRTDGSSIQLNWQPKLGPVIAMHTHNNTDAVGGGTYIKPHQGETHVGMCCRGHEWIKMSDGSIDFPMGQMVSSAAYGHSYNVVWTFNDNAADFNSHFTATQPTSWTTTGGASHPNDGGVWTLACTNDTGLTNGTIKATISVGDDPTWPNYISVQNWYPAKSISLSVTDLAAVVGSRYWVKEDSSSTTWEDCGTSLTNLVLGGVDAWGRWSEYNIEIYINSPAGNSHNFSLTYNQSNQESYFSNFSSISVDDLEEGYTYNGQACNICVGFEMDESLMFAYEETEYGTQAGRLYPGMEIPMTLTGTFGSEHVYYPVTITVGLFGRIVWDNVYRALQAMSGKPQVEESFMVFAELGDVASLSSVYITDPNVETEVTFSDSDTENHVIVSYNDSGDGSLTDGCYVIQNPYDPYAPGTTPFWAKGSITFKVKVDAPWYNFEQRVVRFEKYMNFYRTDSDNTTEYALVDAPWSSTGAVIWSANQNVTSSSGQKFKFDSFVTKGGYTLYFITFRITVDSNGYTQIYRMTPSSQGSNYVLQFWGQSFGSTPSGTPLAFTNRSNSNFNPSSIGDAGYSWFGQCTLVKNNYITSYNGGQGMFYGFTAAASSGTVGRPTYSWNISSSYYASNLDDYPIWADQWTLP